MLFDDEITINVSKLEKTKQKIPSEDFISEQYDVDCNVSATDALVILSSERSGSTMLSGLLYKNKSCLAHEYFQPYDYIPILAERWSCLDHDVLDKEAYVKNLLRFRTYSNGWLGINIHGGHLRHFLSIYKYFSGLRMHYVHLVRRDIISQAVSFEIAAQTGQWTSDFNIQGDPDYNYDGIRGKLERIQCQNALIRAFLTTCNASCQTIAYEDLVQEPGKILRTMPCITRDQPLEIESGLRKQSAKRNKEWMQRFATEYLERSDRPEPKVDVTSESRLKRLLGKVLGG